MPFARAYRAVFFALAAACVGALPLNMQRAQATEAAHAFILPTSERGTFALRIAVPGIEPEAVSVLLHAVAPGGAELPASRSLPVTAGAERSLVERVGPADSWFTIHLDLASMRGGMYDLVASTRGGSAERARWSVYVPAVATTVVPATQGTKYVLVPSPGSVSPTFRDARGKPVARLWAALRPMTLSALEPPSDAGGGSASFTLDDTGEKLTLPLVSGGLGAANGLFALDPSVPAPVRALTGRTLYAYGGTVAAGLAQKPVGDGRYTAPATVAQRISAVYRIVAMPSLVIGNGTAADSGSAFSALDPLLVVLQHDPKGPFAAVYRTFAGTWDFERAFSVRSPSADHPEWPTAMRRAVLRGNVLPGMTYEMVAWTLGYPSTYGTIAELERLTRWTYDEMPPFEGIASFANGHLVKYAPPQQLP